MRIKAGILTKIYFLFAFVHLDFWSLPSSFEPPETVLDHSNFWIISLTGLSKKAAS